MASVVIDIREAWYRVLPRFAQGFLTWLSAKPYAGEPPTAHTPIWHLATALASIATGLAVFAVAASTSQWPLMIGSWLFTTSGLRKLQVVVFHHCAHGTVLTGERWNAVLGEIISGVVLIKSFAAYKPDHARHHSRKYLLTVQDETVQFLVAFAGLEPGLSRRRLWRRLLLNFLNPIFHLRWLADRVISCFVVSRGAWRAARLALWCATLTVVGALGCWQGFLLAWMVPLTLCYNVSATLRLAAEHRWPGAHERDARASAFVCATTVAVFVGAALPEARGWRWLAAMPLWGLRMLGHLLARVTVLVGDTPCHDFHHRRPASPEWANHIFARQADFDQGCPGYPRNYDEVWGLVRAIDQNFALLSTVEPSTLVFERRGLPALWSRTAKRSGPCATR